MQRAAKRRWILLVVLVLLGTSRDARADVAPPPLRPSWEEPPPPLPAPPTELWIALMMSAGLLFATRQALRERWRLREEKLS